MFDFLKPKNTEQGTVVNSTVPAPIVEEQPTHDAQNTVETSLTTVSQTAANAVISSEATYTDKINAMVEIAATSKALGDKKLQKTIVDNKAQELRNKSEAYRINSKTNVNEEKAKSEKSLYNRYKYVYELFGINKEIPAFYCVVILAIYFVFGTIYAVLIGIPFMVVNLLVDSLAALFAKINGLTKNIWGGFKYTFMCLTVLLVLATIGGILYWLIKLIGIF